MSYLSKVEYVPPTPDPSVDRSLLVDSIAERAALASFIMRPESRRNLAADLRLHHFADPAHRRIWPVVTELHSKNATIDRGILIRELGRREIVVCDHEIDTVLAHDVSDVAGDIAQIVKLQRHRWTLDQSAELRRLALDTSVDIVSELETKALDILRAVRQSGAKRDGAAGMKRFDALIADMLAGRLKNIDWPFAPMMTMVARALEACTITMIGGSPGDGKTFMILQSMIGWIEAGIGVAVCMLEKRDAWHLRRCLALLEQSSLYMNPTWAEENPDTVNETIAKHRAILEKLSESIHEGQEVGTSLPEISRWIDRQLDHSDIVIVDPISLADQGDKRWLADTTFIQACIRSIERTNGRIVLVTHPNSNVKATGLTSLMGGLVYQRATDAVLHITKHDKPKRYQVARVTNGIKLNYRITANRTISVFKGRNATHPGAKFAFSYEGLTYAEQGWVLKDEKDDGSGVDDEPDVGQETDNVIDRVPDNIFERRSS